jgi:putative copper export protein
MAPESLTVWLEAAPKALVYIAVLLAVGACAVKWLVVPRADVAPEQRDACEHRLARVLLTATAAAVLALLLRWLAHTFAAFGPADWRTGESLRVIAVDSQWGEGWRLQLICAGLGFAAALLIPGHKYIGWPTATVAAIALCLSTPLLGHAAGSGTRLTFHALHLLGGGAWLGGLACIVLVGPRAALLARFTPVALAGSSLIVLAGLVMAVEYVAQVSNLWRTTYGRTLLLKLAFFAGVSTCGYLNWRKWGSGPGASAAAGSDRTARVESLLALAVVLVTALLTELEHP